MNIAFKTWYENLENNPQAWNEAIWDFAINEELINDHSEYQEELNPHSFYESLEKFIYKERSEEWHHYVSKLWDDYIEGTRYDD